MKVTLLFSLLLFQLGFSQDTKMSIKQFSKKMMEDIGMFPKKPRSRW